MSVQDRIGDSVAEALFEARSAIATGDRVAVDDAVAGARDAHASRWYLRGQADALIACAEALDGIRQALASGDLTGTITTYTVTP